MSDFMVACLLRLAVRDAVWSGRVMWIGIAWFGRHCNGAPAAAGPILRCGRDEHFTHTLLVDDRLYFPQTGRIEGHLRPARRPTRPTVASPPRTVRTEFNHPNP
ncbi:hypothetical protein GCM10010507_42560 [Streptomyces cinnamoneus]|uniref:Uncharacterized protein n=1 Tax=Streptomyces cinnamoneus TaxID=53446 RepID=A0A918TS87_STRCJ|nr:hypothetical protein GCM10010507_42560 [Streptomyces cinnamoneus]